MAKKEGKLKELTEKDLNKLDNCVLLDIACVKIEELKKIGLFIVNGKNLKKYLKKVEEQARKDEREKIFKIVRKQYGTHSSHTYTDMVELLERKEGGKKEGRIENAHSKK